MFLLVFIYYTDIDLTRPAIATVWCLYSSISTQHRKRRLITTVGGQKRGRLFLNIVHSLHWYGLNLTYISDCDVYVFQFRLAVKTKTYYDSGRSEEGEIVLRYVHLLHWYGLNSTYHSVCDVYIFQSRARELFITVTERGKSEKRDKLQIGPSVYIAAVYLSCSVVRRQGRTGTMHNLAICKALYHTGARTGMCGKVCMCVCVCMWGRVCLQRY